MVFVLYELTPSRGPKSPASAEEDLGMGLGSLKLKKWEKVVGCDMFLVSQWKSP